MIHEYWNWPSNLNVDEAMIETVLTCFKEIEFPEDMGTLVIKFIGPSLKILKFLRDDVDTLPRPTKRQKTE